MYGHTKTQVKKSSLPESGFTLDKVMFWDIDFHKLNLTRGSSYLPSPKWIANKKGIINPKNENMRFCFGYTVTVA